MPIEDQPHKGGHLNANVPHSSPSLSPRVRAPSCRVQVLGRWSAEHLNYLE